MRSTPGPPETKRPHPIRYAMGAIGGTILAVGTAVNGLLSAATAQLTDGTSAEVAAPAVPVVLQILVIVLAAAGVIRRAEAETTPSADPASTVNGYLVSLVEDEEQMYAALHSRPGGQDDRNSG